MPARKKSSKPKKATTKKSAAKKPAPSFVPPDEEIQPVAARACIKRGTRWFCMKPDGNGHMVVCDGPFASKEDCEENAVCP